MGILNNSTERLCGFYISDWHLTTMLLPYINKKINENANIVTILENNIQENIKTLVEKLNLKNTKEVLKIDWTKNKNIKFSEISKKLEKIQNEQENIILINGKKGFIDKVNKNINKFLLKNKINSKLKIINCFEVEEFNGNITEILDEHDKILNTAGEKEIADVFEGYEKKEERKKVANE